MKNIMVCVTVQKTCERLIRRGCRERSAPEDELHVVNVSRSGDKLLGARSDQEALEYLYVASREAGASMTVLRSEQVLPALEKYIQEQKISLLIMGTPGRDKPNPIYEQLVKDFPKLEIIIEQ